MPLVKLPETRALVEHDAAGGQALFADSPLLQLAPVERERVIDRPGGNDTFRLFTFEDSQSQLGRSCAFRFEVDQSTADDPTAEIRAIMAIDGGIRSPGEGLHDLRRDERLADTILEHLQVVDDTALWKVSDLAQEVLHR